MSYTYTTWESSPVSFKITVQNFFFSSLSISSFPIYNMHLAHFLIFCTLFVIYFIFFMLSLFKVLYFCTTIFMNILLSAYNLMLLLYDHKNQIFTNFYLIYHIYLIFLGIHPKTCLAFLIAQQI